MKKINGNAIGFTLFVFIIFYLLFSFLYLEWDFLEWVWSGKVMYVILVGFFLNFGFSDGGDD